MRKLAIAVVSIWWMQASAQQGTGSAVLANVTTAKFVHEQGDPAGSESVTLREDPKTGAVELFARYPAGHVFSPHWHSSNERMIVVEGRMSVRNGDKETLLDAGGYAYLPAKEVQRMACVSTTRCTFYVFWDGKLDFNPAR